MPDLRPPVVLSIRPRFARAILAGTKTIEIRRRYPLSNGPSGRAFIYSTAPDKALLGEVTIDAVRPYRIDRLWAELSAVSGVRYDELEGYLGPFGLASVLFLGTPRRFRDPIFLSDLRKRHRFTPPQSYAYASLGLIQDLDHREKLE